MKYQFAFLILVFFQIHCFAQQKEVIFTENAPKPLGAYSQAVKANGIIYVAGQLGIDPISKKLNNSTFEAEAKQLLENIKAILGSVDLDMSAIVNTTIYIKDLKNFPRFNEIYATYFDGYFPARTTVGCADLPGGAALEIAVIAASK